jgi:hypothetical protein
MSEVIFGYPELELGGQSVQTKKGAKGAKKMYINYRVVECNDKREFEEYSEDEQCTQKNFLQYGNYLVTDATVRKLPCHRWIIVHVKHFRTVYDKF